MPKICLVRVGLKVIVKVMGLVTFLLLLGGVGPYVVVQD
jgi:hypothetical protein